MYGSTIKKTLRIFCFVILLFLSSFCEKDSDDNLPAPPYAEIERTIRNKYDSYAVFTWLQYTQLLDVLSREKFIVLPINEMRNTYNDSRVVVGLRHDVDCNPFKAFEMAQIE